MSAKETRVDVESNTSGWNQTCKNLIRFLQDRISNKREKKKSGSSSSIGSTKISIQIKLMIFLLLFLGLVEKNCEERNERLKNKKNHFKDSYKSSLARLKSEVAGSGEAVNKWYWNSVGWELQLDKFFCCDMKAHKLFFAFYFMRLKNNRKA